jgi:predicted nucleic-acid-binding protein
MMFGLDTNILVRYITNDDPKWSPIAKQFIDSTCTVDEPGFINALVLAEVVWVLSGYQGYNKEKTASLIREFLDADNLYIDHAPQVEIALERFKNSTAGFTDCLIAVLNFEAGATPTYSIDQAAVKSGIFAALNRE